MKSPPRSVAIDALRGVAMILMVLDHARDFALGYRPNPTSPFETTLPLFFTRWATYTCAPTFLFLAGASVRFAAPAPSTSETLSKQRSSLILRGLWLMLLEVTLVRLPWMLNVDYRYTVLQVIWAIGVALIVLALLLPLGPRTIAAIAAVLLLAACLFEQTNEAAFKHGSWVGKMFIEGGTFWVIRGRVSAYVAYPLVQWFCLVALGYAFAAVRSPRLFLLGASLTTAFVVLRVFNLSDTQMFVVPASTGPPSGAGLISFLNCTKYPPSIGYLLMTFGPIFMLWAYLERWSPSRLTSTLAVYGRTPLFFYVLHLFLLRACVLALELSPLASDKQRAMAFTRQDPGFPLSYVYFLWLVVVLALFPLCSSYWPWKSRQPRERRGYL